MAIDHESPFKELRLKNRRIMVSYLAGAAHPLPSVFCSPRALPFSICLLASQKQLVFFPLLLGFGLVFGTNAYLCAAMAAMP